MIMADLSLLAVLAAAAVSFVFGGLWYGLLAKHWAEAVGREPGSFKDSLALYLLTIAAQAIMAAVLAAALAYLVRAGVEASMVTGMVTGAGIWFGFVVTTMTVNYAYHGAQPKLTLIDGAHWLGVLLIQGAILGLWGT